MARPKKPLIFTIKDELYESETLVCVGTPYADAWKRYNQMLGRTLQDMQIEDKPSHAAFVLRTEESRRYCMWFRWHKPPGHIVAHECFHLVFHLFRDTGIVLTEDSEESWAYYLSWLVRQIGRKVW